MRSIIYTLLLSLTIFFSATALIACSSGPVTEQTAEPEVKSYTLTIKGVPGAALTAPGELILAQFDPITQKTFDEQRFDILPGQPYSFSLELTEPRLYNVKQSNTQSALLLASPQDNTISLTGPAEPKGALLVEGGSDNDLLAAYDVFRKESLDRLIKPTYADMQSAKKARDKKAEVAAVARYVKNSNVHRKELLDFTEKEIGTSHALFGTVLRWTGDDETDRLRRIVDAYAAAHPGTEMATVMLDKVARYEKTAIGAPAPELEGETPDGTSIKLSENLGKVTLIDFWASWCGPCISQLPDLHAVQDEFGERGLTIFGLSVDNKGDRWKRAIERHNMLWLHASDLAGWDSPNANRYNVTFVPYNVLLDAEGRIVAKNLHETELREKIQELLEAR